MRFLCLYKAAKPEGTPPTQEEMTRMGKLIEESFKSGTLLATEGCLPSALGSRVRMTNGKFKVIDGQVAHHNFLVATFPFPLLLIAHVGKKLEKTSPMVSLIE